MTVGEKIKAFRKEKGLTQKQLAEKSGMIEESIRGYELGKRHPKKETLLRIAQALDVQIGELDDSLGVFTEYDLETVPIGKRIATMRREKGLTQKQLAELTGLAVITIAQYEGCKYVPGTGNLLKIIKVLEADPIDFGVDPDEFNPFLNHIEIIKTRLLVVKTKLMSGLVIQAYQELNEVLEVMK